MEFSDAFLSDWRNRNFGGDDINIVIETGAVQDTYWQALFRDFPVHRFPSETTMFDLLVHFELFKSKSEAKRNWKKSGAEIPWGFSEFTRLGFRRVNLVVWKPLANQT